MKKYITTTLPYVNADPHIGFALEIVQADVVARFWKSQGHEVFFNTGTDEHGLKIYKRAAEEKKDTQAYVDEYAEKFQNLKAALNLSYTDFIRTTNPAHKKAAQQFWKLCDAAGYIYKKLYKIRYCVGCELEKTESELLNGKCPLHPNDSLEIFEEENYFFKFSAFQEKLIALYDKNPDFLVPDFRFKELRNFIKDGLDDFSISRLKSKMPWGIEVPGDPEHIIYVWFEALVNYISTLGWPSNEAKFNEFWPGIQVAGKDNLRQQAAMWQAMLMAAGLPNSRQIVIHGFITSEGKKMSKSLGNVIDPFELVKKYGTDAVRYYLLREIPPFDDGDYSESRMKELYNSDLANELGNLVSRITKIAEGDGINIITKTDTLYDSEIGKSIDKYEFNKALEEIWLKIKDLNKKTDEFAPWKKTKDERNDFLNQILSEINHVGHLLSPFLPESAEKIIQTTQGTIKKAPVLFPKT